MQIHRTLCHFLQSFPYCSPLKIRSPPAKAFSRLSSSRKFSGMDLKELMRRINSYASPDLAAGWDNVGLLVEPSPPHVVTRLLMTNDLTSDVVAEAVRLKANMILSYHPPIFKAVKSLTQKSWKERIIVKCIENRIAVYSPHTILDTLKGGVTDWLISPFGGHPQPLRLSHRNSTMSYSVTAVMSHNKLGEFRAKLSTIEGAVLHSGVISTFTDADAAGDEPLVEPTIKVSCTSKALSGVVDCFTKIDGGSKHLEVIALAPVPVEGCGDGRITTLDTAMSLREAVDCVKNHLKLDAVRLAIGFKPHSSGSGPALDNLCIRSVAVCAGSGGSVLSGARADLYVTGEMSHHELLDATESGTSVILCEHSNTERGFLQILARTFENIFEGMVSIDISTEDHDPVVYIGVESNLLEKK